MGGYGYRTEASAAAGAVVVVVEAADGGAPGASPHDPQSRNMSPTRWPMKPPAYCQPRSVR